MSALQASYDVGGVGQTLVANEYVIAARASGSWQTHDHTFGETRERDSHDTAFAEVSARRKVGRHAQNPRHAIAGE